MLSSLWGFVRRVPASLVSTSRNNHTCSASPSPLHVRTDDAPRTFWRRPAALAAAACLLAIASTLHAQVTYSGTQSTLASLPSFSSISPVAVDAVGDSFFVASNGSANTLYELPQNGSLKTLNSAFPYLPLAIAVSPNGSNLYFAYLGATNCTVSNSYVAIAPVSTGIPQNLPCSFSFSGYTLAYIDVQGLAVDSSGNLYIADFGGGQIDKIPAAVTASSVPSSFITLTSQPWDIAVAPNGTIYFGALNASSQNTLYSVSPSSFGSTIPVSGAASQTDVANNIPSIQSGLAVDSSGTLYVGGNPPVSITNGTQTPLSTTLSNVTGVAVGPSGDPIFGGTNSSGVPAIMGTGELAAVAIGSVPVGSTSSTQTLSFNVQGGTTINSISVLTSGASGLDFAQASGSTCAVQSYSTTTSCTIHVTVTPTAAGLRMGSVVISSNKGKLFVPVYATGTGPQIAFSPGTQSTVLSGLTLSNRTLGMAVDPSGNLYVSTFGSAVKAVRSGATYGSAVNLDSDLSSSDGVAVDGGGNVYITGFSPTNSNSVVVKLPWTGSGYGAAVSLPFNGLGNDIEGVAVDGAGNVYDVDLDNRRVVKLPWNSATGSYGTQSTLPFSGLNDPYAVTVDGSGNVYVSDLASGTVIELPWNSTTASYGTQVTVASGLSFPAGLVVNANGDVYVADNGDNRVAKIPRNGSSYGAAVTAVSGLSFPMGVTLDSSGNLFILNVGTTTVVEVNVSTPPAVNFPTATALNTADSTDDPQTVTVENIGNTNLILPIPGTGNNPSVATGFSLDGATTCPQLRTSSSASGTLAPGASCTYAVDFTPTAVGANSGSLVLTDNNLNAIAPAYTTQTISLSGTGIDPQATHFSVTAPVTATAGTPVSVIVTALSAGNTTATSYTGTVHFTSTDTVAVLPPDLTLTNGVGTVTAILKTAGNQAITATDTVNASITGTSSVTVSAGTPAQLIANAGTPQSAYVNTAFSTPLTMTVTDAYGNPVSGQTVTYTAPASGASAALSSPASTNPAGQTSITAAANGTVGSYTVTAALNGLNVSFSLTNQSAPNLVVTTPLDDSGTPSNCTVQSTPGTGTDASCSLRDALLKAGTLGSGNITFDSRAFASAQTIQLLTPSGTLTIPNSTTITGATSGSGTLQSNLVTVSGGGLGSNFSVFAQNSGVATIANLTITNGSTSGTPGGGIAQTGGTLTISRSTISNNSVNVSSVMASGGGISSNSGVLTITSSAVSGNSINICGAGITGSLGGGGIASDNGTLAITSSTISANSITDCSSNPSLRVYGAGIVSDSYTSVTDSTISGNSMDAAGDVTLGGGIAFVGGPQRTITRSIVAGNTAQTYADVYGTYVDGGANQAGTNSSGISQIAIGLAPLANYGGPTQTMIPLPLSPAICAISPSSASGTDQRGNPRTTTYSGTVCQDSGAVQTNYSLSFSTNPPATVPALTNFSAGVALNENGTPFTATSVSIPLALNATAGTLTNGGSSPVAASTTNGVATYSTLQVNLPGTNDTLTANLPLTASGAATPVTLTANSSGFAVNGLSTTTAASNITATYSTAAQSLTLQAIVTSGGGTVNSGTVTFTVLSGGTPVGAPITSGTVTNGSASASFTLPAGTAAGLYTIEAVYNASGAFATSSDSTHTLTIAKATETVIWTTAPEITYGTSLSSLLTATAAYNSQSLAGTFSYTAQTGASAAIPVTASTVLPAGSYTLTTTFTPSDATDFNTGSASVPLTVNTATLTITANNATKVYGTANPAFSGTVTGMVNGDSFAETFSTAATNSSNVGTYPILPSVSGTNLPDYQQSITNGTLIITQAASTTSLSVVASISPATPLTINARVVSSTTGTPTGTVSFYDSGALLNTAALTNGSANFSTASLTPGMSHVLSAVYSGDTNFTASSSTSTATVTVASLDFTLAITGATSQTVVPGSPVTYQATVTPLYGNYAGPVNFAVTGLPPGATVNFSPSTIAASSGPQTVTVTIQTATATAMRRTPSRLEPFAAALLLLPLLGTAKMRKRGRTLQRLVCVALLTLAGVAASVALSGCGSGGNGLFAQPSQNYTVSITATSGSLQHTATVTLNVQ